MFQVSNLSINSFFRVLPHGRCPQDRGVLSRFQIPSSKSQNHIPQFVYKFVFHGSPRRGDVRRTEGFCPNLKIQVSNSKLQVPGFSHWDSDIQHPTSVFRLPTSDFQLPSYRTHILLKLSILPLNTLKSTFPPIPSTLPCSLCCHIIQRVLNSL